MRLGTDYEIRNGGHFETIKNGADHFRYDSFQMAKIMESVDFEEEGLRTTEKNSSIFFLK